MNSPVETIKERLSIEDVVSSYIKLERSGSNLRARCPFHNEKTPSFFVSPDRGSYYCFGCGAKGDIFTFVEEFEGLDFKGALKLLADRAGVPLGQFNPKEEGEKERLYRIMEAAAIFFQKNLPEESVVLEYLKSRGLTEESIRNFRIGFIREAWRDLYSHLTASGFSDNDIEKAGLAKRTEKGFYDRFRGRIMFPISDSSGRIIAFTGRLFVDDGKSAKYLNSPDTPIFNKSMVLYGLDRAKESVRKNNFSILVEGQMDLILSHQAGFKNTVAASGTALSDATISKENLVSNLGLIRRLSGNIVIAFDADRAGFAASQRAARIALALGMDVKVAKMPEGIDPADLISKTGPEAWREAVRGSKHIVEFMLGKILEVNADARKAAREIKDKVLPYVDSLESMIEKAHFIKIISEASGIPEDAIREDLKKVSAAGESDRKETQIIATNVNERFRKDYISDRLLGIIVWQKGLPNPALDADNVLKRFAEILKKTPEEVMREIEDKKEDLIFEAEIFYGTGPNLEEDTEELLGNLEEEYLKEELLRKMQELHIVESREDPAGTTAIVGAINELNKKIQSIKSGRGKK